MSNEEKEILLKSSVNASYSLIEFFVEKGKAETRLFLLSPIKTRDESNRSEFVIVNEYEKRRMVHETKVSRDS